METADKEGQGFKIIKATDKMGPDKLLLQRVGDGARGRQSADPWKLVAKSAGQI
jgi:hypothetical protein